MNELLCDCHNTFDKPTKIKKIDVLFSWLSKNLHLFENSGLLNIVKQKIMEFAIDPMGKAIHDKYGWMLDLHSPPGKYSSFGRKITTNITCNNACNTVV